jgi:hypothetical protein
MMPIAAATLAAAASLEDLAPLICGTLKDETTAMRSIARHRSRIAVSVRGAFGKTIQRIEANGSGRNIVRVIAVYSGGLSRALNGWRAASNAIVRVLQLSGKQT